ncbi:MAG: phosphosulfolactate synthase [Haliea sp.]
MKVNTHANDFVYEKLAGPERQGKPRKTGLTVVADSGTEHWGWLGPEGSKDFLEAASEYVDQIKIVALTGLMLPHEHTKKKVKLYKDYDVLPFVGGLLWEVGYLQNAVDEVMTHMRRLGVEALEISENYVTLDWDTRLKEVNKFHKAGFKVISEYGRKHPDVPMTIEDLGTAVTRLVDAGVDHVILEQGEIDLLAAEAPQVLNALGQQPWFDHVVLEPDTGQYPKQHCWMIEAFGPNVSMCNIRAGHVIRMEGFRRGLGRQVHYHWIEDLVEKFEQAH